MAVSNPEPAVEPERVTKVAKYDTGEATCPYRLVLEHLTSRWGVLVLIELLERPYRFSELRRAIGRVSEKMLTQTLQTLERDGLVHREALPVVPPHVEYRLTELGDDLVAHMLPLAAWLLEHAPAIVSGEAAASARVTVAAAG